MLSPSDFSNFFRPQFIFLISKPSACTLNNTCKESSPPRKPDSPSNPLRVLMEQLEKKEIRFTIGSGDELCRRAQMELRQKLPNLTQPECNRIGLALTLDLKKKSHLVSPNFNPNILYPKDEICFSFDQKGAVRFSYNSPSHHLKGSANLNIRPIDSQNIQNAVTYELGQLKKEIKRAPQFTQKIKNSPIKDYFETIYSRSSTPERQLLSESRYTGYALETEENDALFERLKASGEIARLERFGWKQGPAFIVLGASQTLLMLSKSREGRIAIRKYTLSTGLGGVNGKGDRGTPPGMARLVFQYNGIRGKKAIERAGMGAEFKEGQVARRRIASVNESGKPATMSTRVLQLQSLEPSNARFQQGAYFAHGTNRERTLGEAASDGCLRFSNLDIVEIAHLIGGEGALVDIRDDLPPVPTRRSKPSLQQRESLLSNEKPVVSEAASLILPENDRRFVASIEAKIWPNLDELEARDPLGPRLISIAELKSLLTQEEQDFIDRLLAIDPKTLGIQVPKVPSIEVPRNQLVGLSSSLPHSLEDSVRYPMTPQARAAFLAMRTACAAATKEWINPSSAYRSDGYQLALFITNLNKNNFDLKKTASRVTFPGYSEHGSIRNGNMAMDLQTESAHGDAFLRSQSYTWLTKHAAEYGFSLSYPENNPTGIDFEPWHWRFDRKRWEAQLEKNNPTREDIYRFIVSQSPLDKAVEFTHQPREIIARQLANALVDAMHSNQIPITDVTLAICLAQIEREGEFLLDPPIPNPVKMYNRYKNKALTDIRSRLRQISPHAETVVMPIVLNQVIPRYEKVYRDKIYACKTERDLERILTNIVADLRADKKISSLFSIPFIGDNLRAEFEKGIQILEDPIKRVGMMQVDVDKALSIARAQGKEITRPQMRETLYSLEGNLQYGLNLLAIPIKAYLTDDKGAVECVFADYNAGEFASRNAAVQDYLNTLLRTHDPSFPNLVLDGDLLSYKEARVPNSTLSNSEKAFIQFGKAYKISSLTPDQIRKDLLLEKTPEFEQTLTYRSLRETYAKVFHSQPAYARLPEISTDTAEKLGRPNITTDHYVSGSKRRYTLIQSQMRSRT